MKKTILADFDGVLHEYIKPWQGADVIPDGPVPGAIEWLQSLIHDARFEVCIYSSRSRQPGGVDAMIAWLRANGISVADIKAIQFPTEKPAAFLTIDDRCICFEGKFPSLSTIDSFVPWNKKTGE